MGCPSRVFRLPAAKHEGILQDQFLEAAQSVRCFGSVAVGDGSRSGTASVWRSLQVAMVCSVVIACRVCGLASDISDAEVCSDESMMLPALPLWRQGVALAEG